jgi:hypothetical protein
MSYTEKHENISKDEWMNRLEGLHIQRADMNKLIMNYLVTGKLRNTSSLRGFNIIHNQILIFFIP